MKRLLAPRSIAVIGASDQPGNLGGTAVRFLTRFGYPGNIWPVNPRRTAVAGLPCFARVADLPGSADLAIIAVGAPDVADLVSQCAQSGIRFGVVWAGGFAEVGPEGTARQDALTKVCRETGFGLVGPNCIGIINTWLPMTATFASFLLEADRLVAGPISMLSQSGGIATMAHALAQQAGFGFRYTISSGNEAVLTAADFIHALAHDDGTKVIAVYLEGVHRDGERFITALRAARAAGKPLVMLKAGASEASARAAAAHTGALVGESRVWDAILDEHAVIRVDSLGELLDVALFLGSIDLGKLPAGNGVAAITFGGGGGVLAADQCARHGLATPRLTEATRRELQPLVPPIASVENPIDLTPQTFNQTQWMAQFPEALAVIASDPGIHTLFFQCGPMARSADEVIDAIRDVRARTAKTVCLAWPLAPSGVPHRLLDEGFYAFTEYAQAIACIARISRYRAALSRPTRPPGIEVPAFDWNSYVPAPSPGQVISEHECHRILSAAGMCVPAAHLATSPEDALAAAREIGFPVALKGIASAVTHRAKAGLIALDIRSDGELGGAYRELTGRAGEAGVVLDGIYVQRMADEGLEILVSAFRDPVFGVMVSCGAGGGLTEFIDDVVLARAPVDEPLARAMLERLRIVRTALRSGADVNLAPMARFVAALARLAASAPWRRFVLEVNPVRWAADSAVAVDGLLIVEDP